MRAWVLCVVMAMCCCQGRTADSKEIKLPPYVEVCYRDDPKVAECIKRNMEKLMPKFKKGSKDFDLESMDPMLFKNLHYSYKSPILGGELEAFNCYLNGMMESMVVSVRPKLNIPNKFLMDFDLHVPHLSVKSDYKFNGNVLTVPLNAKGRVDVHFEDMNITYHISGDTKTTDNYDYLEIDEFSWKFSGNGIRKLTLRNNDIVDGKPALNRMVKTVINSSWKLIIDQMLPSLLPESNRKLKEKFTKAFKKYPYDIVLPRRTRMQKEEVPYPAVHHNSPSNGKREDMIS